MTFSNPLQALMQMGRGPMMNALPNIQKPAQNPPINIQQLKQALPQLTKENYAQLVSQARAQGHTCEYANQQPSDTNSDKSSIEGSTTNG